ncbi:MAG: hypothetical protein AXA67_07825 [Methylothermaceae bacteria B42]|nr:MAG: hypothetical protein AXA67_07825 [Methylothermaceae bacteria B42]HHJ37918.1 hypothetical protein [Methylothermaceae bacterium]
MKKHPLPVLVLMSLLASCAAIQDEATQADRDEYSFRAADEDYFRDMDYGLTKHPEKVAAALDPYTPGISPADAVAAVVRGRNNWIVWTGGNDRLWDELNRASVGAFDLLKVVSNHPSLKFNRGNRWSYLGLVNEPCFKKPGAPRQDRFGLWLDERDPTCPPDPFENQQKYPGVKTGARGKTVPVGSYYGYATGIVGLRLFPNPNFDEKAAEEWDPERYYTDPGYYNRKDLVRPYRVGMSCGFCHVGPSPVNPPKDFENPKWENLTSNPGAQYFWWDRIAIWEADESSFVYQIFKTSRPGALDTSFVSTDYINNPRTMNAVYNLGPRMAIARKLGKEKLSGGELNNKRFSDYPTIPENSPLHDFFHKPDSVFTPMVLKDGADSVGALGALNRVYVNIGLFSEEWLRHFRPFVGGKPITPFKISVAEENSAYWRATELQTPDVALFFLASAKPDKLQAAPGGNQYLNDPPEQVKRGKGVFAENCARCHSSKLPEKAFTFFPDHGCNGPNYLQCFNNYWNWTKTDEFKRQMRAIVLQDDFLEDNYLSNELRIPVTLVESNTCSTLATNAIQDNIWNDFSSSSYKALPSVGEILVHHPVTGQPYRYSMPAGGLGYIRVPSLVSIWSQAPFLLNNTVGDFCWQKPPSRAYAHNHGETYGTDAYYDDEYICDGTTEDRMKAFYDGIEKLLWPEKRRGDRRYLTQSGKLLPGVIDRTTATSYLRVPPGFIPDFLKVLPNFRDGIEIGPIPKGTTVNLLANIDLENKKGVIKFLPKLVMALKSLPPDVGDEQAKAAFAPLVDEMLTLNKCPDFIVNRGHYFGTGYLPGEKGLSDDDKKALIAFLKTM